MANSVTGLARPAVHERREWPRYAAEKSFVLTASIDGKPLACVVEDISLGGAKLVFDTAVPADRPIELSHPQVQPVICAPVWHHDREVGIEFDFSEDSLGLISACIRNMIDLERQSPVTA